MKKHLWYDSEWVIQCVDKTGKVLWEEINHNDLVDEGERSFIMAYFRAEELPTEFYVRLAYDSVSLTDGLADIEREPTTNGYVPQLVERSSVGFPTIEQIEGDWRVTSKQVTFTAAGGDIGPINVAFLSTTLGNSGKLIAVMPFNESHIIGDGADGLVRFRVKLK
jgi:hypothetical protein